MGEDDGRPRPACRHADQATTRLVRMPGILAWRLRDDRTYGSQRYTTTFAKAGRERKILIDYLRNNRTNTSVCAFSPRARPGAMVSMPLEWRELGGGPERWTLLTAAQRLKRLKTDPWAGYWTASQGLSNASIRAVARHLKIPRCTCILRRPTRPNAIGPCFGLQAVCGPWIYGARSRVAFTVRIIIPRPEGQSVKTMSAASKLLI